MKRRILTFLILILTSSLALFCQTTSIGQWRTQFSYRQGMAVAQGDGKIFCATAGGLFSYNSDNSFSLLSKLSGLSDLNANVINYDTLSHTLIVAYQDANIDIIQGGVITNLPDLLIANITGSKAVNNIFFTPGIAYLACGFGIVVVDLVLHQTKDTYYIGPLGAAINVRDVNTDGNLLYAATDGGIYTAPLSSPNLNDYNSWTLQTAGLPAPPHTVYNTLACFNGIMYANFSEYLTSNATITFKDQVYQFDGVSTWSPLSSLHGDDFKKLRVNNNTLVAVGEYNLYLINAAGAILPAQFYNKYGFGTSLMADGLVDKNNIGWIADKVYGLVRMPATGPGEIMVPNGPITNNVFSMTYNTGNIWLAPGGVSFANAQYSRLNDGESVYSNNTWTSISGVQPGGNMDTIDDVVCIAVDPGNPKHAFGSSQWSGVLEFNNGAMVKVYNPANSSLKNQASSPNYWQVLAAGIAYDTLGNLWVGNGLTTNLLSVKKPNVNGPQAWQSFNFGFMTGPVIAGLLMITSLNQKWLELPRNNEILVFNDNGTFPVPNTTNSKILKTGVGSGNLPGQTVYCMAEDKNAAVWIGTDQGIAVIYNPANIFNGGSYDAQPVYVQQNGYTQLLFQAEQVNAIAVDGANRKWVGTQLAGAFLMSADGTKQIYNFTTANSPLISNAVTSITINPLTGEVFFGTPKGVVSYRGDATEGGNSFGNVYVFPNPVKHDYNGPIAITNLVNDADVKITDITGTLIFKTTALGGQAIWDGNNFSGQRAHTGVYLVFCSSPDGTQTHVTKLLFIN